MPAATAAARSKPSRRDADAILRERENLVAELSLLRDRGHNSKFIDSAFQLMTRWWSSASWTARQRLLKSATWLLRLEQNRPQERRPQAQNL